MSLTSGFFDAVITSGTPDRTYTAEDMNNILDGMVSDGICKWGNNFDFDLDSSNPNKPYIKSGRGKIAKHWFMNDGTALAALTNSTNNTKYYAVCVSCDLSSRSISFSYKPSGSGGTSIPDIHADDSDTLKTCGLWMIVLPPHTSLSDDDSSWSSLIGEAPDGYPYPNNFTPYVEFLGNAPEPDLTPYVRRDGDILHGTYVLGTAEGPATLKFMGGSSIESTSGLNNLNIKNIKDPVEDGDAVPKQWAEDNFVNAEGGDIIKAGLTFSLPLSYTDPALYFNGVAGGNGIVGDVIPSSGNGRLKITGVRNPVDPTDAVPKQWAEDQLTKYIKNDTSEAQTILSPLQFGDGEYSGFISSGTPGTGDGIRVLTHTGSSGGEIDCGDIAASAVHCTEINTHNGNIDTGNGDIFSDVIHGTSLNLHGGHLIDVDSKIRHSTANASSFTFTLDETGSDYFKTALVFGSNDHGSFLYIVGLGTTSGTFGPDKVYATTRQSYSEQKLTGATYSNNRLTLTFNQTIYGGVYVVTA